MVLVIAQFVTLLLQTGLAATASARALPTGTRTGTIAKDHHSCRRRALLQWAALVHLVLLPQLCHLCAIVWWMTRSEPLHQDQQV